MLPPLPITVPLPLNLSTLLPPAPVNGGPGSSPAVSPTNATSRRPVPPQLPPPKTAPPPPPPGGAVATSAIHTMRSRDNLAAVAAGKSPTSSSPWQNAEYGARGSSANGSARGQRAVPAVAILRTGAAAPNAGAAQTQHRKGLSNGHSSGAPTVVQAPSGSSYGLSNHPYATSSSTSPTTDTFRSVHQRPSKQSLNGGSSSAAPPVLELPPKTTSGYSVGRGGFARPSTPAGTVSVVTNSSPFTLDDLLRKNIKFFWEDGTSKTIAVGDCKDPKEVLSKALKKFAMGRDEDNENLDGWSIWAAGIDGQAKPLSDAELLAICNTPSRPERQRGLILRKTLPSALRKDDRKRPKNKVQRFFGEDTSNSNGLLDPYSQAYENPSANGDFLGELHVSYDGNENGNRKSKRMNRASTVSVMSGLNEWAAAEAPAMPTRRPSVEQSRSSSGGLINRRTLKKILPRPPSELISTHLAEYFPMGRDDKKHLPKAVRDSMRRSSKMMKRASQFSTSSGGVDWQSYAASHPPPMLPPLSPIQSASVEGTLVDSLESSGGRSSDDSNRPAVPAKDNQHSSSSRQNHGLAHLTVPALSGPASDSSDDRASITSSKRKTRPPSSRRISSSSRMSYASSRFDSDNASLLTVDEVTAEIASRRASMYSRASNASVKSSDDHGKPAKASATDDGHAGDTTISDSGSGTLIDTEAEASEDEDISSDEDSEDESSEESSDEDDSDSDADSDEDEKTDTRKPDNAKSPFKWVKGRIIGRGSFGVVVLGLNAVQGSFMAVKQVEIPAGSSHTDERKKLMLVALEHEIELLKVLQHPNIVQYLDSYNDGVHLNIFLEYVAGGSVATLLIAYGAFEEALVRTFIKQILTGLDYLHVQGILHRDIKGANILVEPKGGVKISDFGISKKMEHSLLTKVHRPSLQGSVFWMAPEVVKQVSYTTKADIWSLGALALEMLTGDHPWPDLNQMQAIFKIGSSSAPTIPEDITSDCADFLGLTFRIDHEQRPTAAELLEHPFITTDPDHAEPTPTRTTFSEAEMATTTPRIPAAATA